MDAADIRGCWCAHDISLRQHIEADLGETKTIVGVATQGYVSHDNWVASYRLGYRDEGGPQRWYQEDHDEKVRILQCLRLRQKFVSFKYFYPGICSRSKSNFL